MSLFDAAFALLSQALLAGVIVADSDGRVMSMNETAEHILSAKDGLTLQDGIVTPARAFERARLSNVFAKLEEAADGSADRFLVGRLSSRFPYALLVVPFRDETRHAFALIIVTDFDLRTSFRPEVVTELFGFTAAEARLAIAIANGKELAEVAQETGRAVPTLRAQLRALFKKADVTRQAELVRLILGIPAVRL